MSVRDHYTEDQIFVHQISKEDRDLILEYNLVEKREVPKVDFLGVKIDNISSRNELVVKILDLVDQKGVHYIHGVDPLKIMLIRNHVRYKRIFNKASLIFAAAGGMKWASQRMHQPLDEWVNYISLIVDLVRLSEVKQLPIYFLGSRPAVIERAFFNLKKSFPNMRVVGRHTGIFDPQREKDVIEAIRKTSPKILMVGMGYPKELDWIERNRKEFHDTVIISVGGSFDLISGKIKKAPDFFQNRGLTWLYRTIIRPYQVLRVWYLIKFVTLVYFINLFRKPNRKK